ncbi:hypothetical protein DSY4542 [Desulfitobacterium hafniense Y51]|uniref:Uncharacterized protein n=1 Tax=Desulfitobacterium hafniense (strain Y51) TaxID=138119 RepID=Q24NR1_DESHY|nr:hypothetical protein DSY4542 [Desulfitobacterium hafniense Y51]
MTATLTRRALPAGRSQSRFLGLLLHRGLFHMALHILSYLSRDHLFIGLIEVLLQVLLRSLLLFFHKKTESIQLLRGEGNFQFRYTHIFPPSKF